ncbi:nitrilase [Microbacterium sp. SORGH_AS 1204]|uniref:carbon-nitrogen hydrolase family protein n=1 Tax=Microbacterium sp. SORGH_AS_1204 TaxID=3041785 RepID=UPI0027942F44|nr:carbon-nitrogen hydrolase family protein [Microbacterium sp. SORGH_AS_1204]MDQ1138165.1 nitrilase [Microbacterium sp. SORGH_AS_1204]
MTSITVAVVQAGSLLFDTPASLMKAETFIRDAAAQGAALVVLPEAFLGGYPKGVDFGITVGSRSPEGRDMFKRYADSAITLPGQEVTHLAELSAELGIDIVAGVIEREGGTLYCATVFITATGGHVATHRKLMPTAAERYLWGQGDGSTLATIETSYGRVGSAICWENYMPLFRTAMYQQGVQLWCAPTVDDRDAWSATMRHIALEGRCFVLSANQYLLRSDLPEDVHPVQGEDPDTLLIGGGSMIVSPLGDVLAGPLRGREGILVAEVDLDDITRAQFDLDVTGHYSRPDIFTLTTDTTRRQG